MIDTNENKPFISHLEELRSRFLFTIASLTFFSFIGYVFHDELIAILIRPLSTPLIYTSPTGALDFIFKISVIFGLICTTPIFLFHFFKFILPALPKVSTRLVFAFISLSTISLILGVLFAYFLILPSALHFLSNFGSTELDPLISTADYLDFVSLYILGFGLIFQTPLILFFVNYFYKLPINRLFKYSKFVILFGFIFAAIITPTPDAINQFLMATPLILLYFLSIILIWIYNKNTIKY